MTKTITQTFSVSHEYRISFTKSLFNTSNTMLPEILKSSGTGKSVKTVVVMDDGVAAHHPLLTEEISAFFTVHAASLSLCAAPLLVTGGEATKNSLTDVEKVLHLINDAKVDRHAFIIAIGGGAVLDMVGFAASIGHRGIGIIRVPTTVLSQNDSGVGVKNSVNFFGKKNFLGTFAPPVAVINDSDFLLTLDDRHWRAGISEAIKVALIKDRRFFEWIETNVSRLSNREMEPMQYLIHRCAEMHTEHIGRGGDPFEKGSSRPLDFGHWAAHKLEQLTNFEVLHGEAVAIGICLDVAYSYELGLIDEAVLKRVIRCFQGLGFTIYHDALAATPPAVGASPELIAGLEEFREHLGGELTIMLLKGVGQSTEYHEMDVPTIAKAMAYLRAAS
ncbi:MAG: 3-dehydroquinate synthase [Lewinella sp.]|jgi:3-dehydroquinate synthase|nr:3-dehydroquinate synthase [Lewinella sp.]